MSATKNDKRPVEWTENSERAFSTCKQKLSEASLLFHPRENTKLRLTTDASNIAMGATLEQYVDDLWQLLGFYSKKFTATQRQYSTYDRELLAIYASLKFFRYFVEGQQISIRTDHKPLTYAFQQRSDKTSPRQQRQLDYISQFTTQIRQITGQANTVADCLSRIEQIDMPIIVTTEDIAKYQEDDEELKNLIDSNSSSLKLKKLRCDDQDTQLYCDVSGKDVRLYIPLQLRRQVFNVVHNLAHPSIRSTQKIIARRFVWLSMHKDVTQWIKTCLPCQRNKIFRHVKNTPERIAIPDERFRHIHMDIIGPLRPSKNFKYCLTIIDQFTRWPKAVPIYDTSADTIISAFYSTWVARFGAPSTITTDRGSQFESRLFHSLIHLIGSRKIHITAYHPRPMA